MAVLVTRPDQRGKALVDQLNQAGVVALHLPLLSIEAGAELAQLPTKLNQLKSGDYVFLVSKSAVDFADKTLKDIGFSWRQDLQYFTVGHRTAQHFSCQTECTVRYPITSENTEGVLNLPQMAELTDKKLVNFYVATVDENYYVNRPHYTVQLLRQSNVTNARRLVIITKSKPVFVFVLVCKPLW